MSALNTSVRDDLEDLVKHPGWLRLKAWAKSEWEDRIIAHSMAAADADDTAALARLRQIMAGHRTAQLILDWPESELKKLRPTPAALTQSRTGY